MTKQIIRTFTGNQIAVIVRSRDIISNLNVKYLGIKNAAKLYKLLEKCIDLYNGMVKQISDTIYTQNEKLINDNPQYTDLLKMFATIRHDITACNKFIAEHQELEFLVSVMEDNNKTLLELQNKFADSIHEVSYMIENDKLEKALESKELTVQQISELAFLFE